MKGESVSRFREFFDHVRAPDRSLVVLERAGPDPMVRLLEEGFEDQRVEVTESAGAPTDLVAANASGASDDGSAEASADEESVVALVEGDEVVTTSPISALTESYLMVNSDLYRTGTVGIEEFDPPSVLMDLDETVFSLRGFPASNKEKLLLILVSRYIERIAWEADAGTLRSSFQRLSRIKDERGTRSVYEKLGRSGVDVHVYGVPDDPPSGDWNGTVHGGTSEAYRRSWFVVYAPPDIDEMCERSPEEHSPPSGPAEADAAALVAVETGDNVWDGMWTYRPSLVAEIETYIRRTL